MKLAPASCLILSWSCCTLLIEYFTQTDVKVFVFTNNSESIWIKRRQADRDKLVVRVCCDHVKSIASEVKR